MISLLLKDILIQKRMLLYGIVYIVLISFFFAKMENPAALLSAVLVAITYLFMTNSCALDEKNKADTVFNSLPLHRSEIVGARYISIFMYIFIGLVYYALLSLIPRLIPLPFPAVPFSPAGLLGGFISVIVISGLYFPLYHTFGFIKSRIFNFILFFGVFFVIVPASTFFTQGKGAAFAERLSSKIDTWSSLYLGITAAVLVLLFYFFSFLVSCRLYKRREF